MNTGSKKTILYLITQSELGGAQKYILDLASNLKSEFNIMVGLGEQGKNGELAKKLNDNNIKIYEIPNLKRSISPLNDVLALANIVKLIKKTKPEILHLNSSKISILGSIAKLISHSKAKCIYTVHGWVFNEPLSTWKKIFYKYAEKITAPIKDVFICVSEFDSKIALQERICPINKIQTIHNGIEKINFYPKEGARKKLFSIINNNKLKLDDTIIGSIGNLYKTKGFKYLIKSFISIKKEKLGYKLIIIGEGEERHNLEYLIKKYKLENDVFLIGRINNASKLLKALDAYICSSVKEGLSYTIIEAMMAKLPIISTNVGGNKELIINNKTGILIKSKDSNEIYIKIKKLLRNSNLKSELSSNALKFAEKEFNFEKMFQKTKSVYNSVLKIR